MPVGKHSQVLDAIIDNKLDEVVTILDNESVDPNITDSDGNTALVLAAKGGNLEMVELLLNYGFPVNKRNGRNRTALMYAVKRGFCSLVKRLLATETCDVDAQVRPSLTWFEHTVSSNVSSNFFKSVCA